MIILRVVCSFLATGKLTITKIRRHFSFTSAGIEERIVLSLEAQQNDVWFTLNMTQLHGMSKLSGAASRFISQTFLVGKTWQHKVLKLSHHLRWTWSHSLFQCQSGDVRFIAIYSLYINLCSPTSIFIIFVLCFHSCTYRCPEPGLWEPV